MAAAKGYQYFILFKLLGFFKTSTLPKKKINIQIFIIYGKRITYNNHNRGK